MFPQTRKKKKNAKRKSLRRSNLRYQTLERRQLLAVTAGLSGTDFSLTGNFGSDDVIVSVNSANELQWSQDGGATYTTDLNDGLAGTQTFVMSPAGTTPPIPINVTIDLGPGNDRLRLDLEGHSGWQDVTVVDAGDADVDSVRVVSDLDLLTTGGELNIQAEIATVAPNAIVAAPGGITVTGTGRDALIRIGTNAILSTRTILPGGDHYLDPSLADSTSIELTSSTIEVDDDAKLLAHVESGSAFASGDITLDVSEDLPTSFEFYDLLNDIATGTVVWTDVINLFNQEATAAIEIGAADLLGSSIHLNARADTETEIPTLSDIADAVTSGAGIPAALQVTSDYLSGQLTDFLVSTGVFAAWRVKEVTTAIVQIGDDANLEADVDVIISAKTKSKEKNKVDNVTQAIAVTEVESTSEVTVGERASILAGNEVSVTTDATIEATAEAKTAKNLGAANPAEGTAIAVAVAKSDLNSNISIAEDAWVRAQSDLTIHAKGKQSVSADASSGIQVEGGVGIAASFSLPTSNVTTDIRGSLRSEAGSGQKGIVILAELETDEQSVAMTGLGGAAMPAPVSSLNVNVQNFLNTYIKPIMDVLLLNSVGSLVGNSLDFSTATAVIEADNHVAATIHGSANVDSTLDLDVDAKLTAKVRTFAESVVDQDPAVKPKGDVVSTAVAVGIFNNQTTASIEDGAAVDASRDLSVHASSEYPYNPPLVLVEEGGTRVIEIEGNSWARSHSTDGRSDYAGSLTYQDYNNLTAATIGNGVLVNQTPAFASPQQSVQVTADSDIYTLDIAGLFELVIDVTAITDTNAYQNAFQTGGLPALLTEIQNAATTSWNDSDIDYGAGSEKTGIGGSSAYVDIENETIASIGDEVLLNTGGDGELIVDADSRVRQYSFAMSGIEAGNLGIAGSVILNRHDNQTTASIGVGSQIVGGSISVTSDSELLGMGFAGGVLQAGNYGFGFSVADSKVDRQTNAYIGSPAGGGGGSITSTGDLLVEANNVGGVYGFALSGAIQSEELASSVAPQNTNTISGVVPSNFASAGNQGSYGIAFSGDAAVNHVNNHAHAFIHENAGIDTQRATVRATDETSVVAAAGSAALTSKNQSIGLAGSLAYNDVDGSALAWIQDAQLSTGLGDVLVAAERGSSSGIWSATASAALSKGQLAAANNVSLNKASWKTQANLYDATILAGRDALLLAIDDSKTVSIAAAAALQGKVGFGASFGWNSMTGVTATGIDNSSVDVERHLLLDSVNRSQIVSAAGSFGSGKNFGFAGTAAINELESQVESAITESTVVSGSSVTVNAADESSILSISGAVVAYQGSGFGGALAINQLNQSVNASIDQSDVNADQSVSVTANGTAEIKSFAVGVAGQESVGLAVSVAINRLDSIVESSVTDSVVTAISGVNVQADSADVIGSFAGGFAGAGSVAVGAAVSLNDMVSDVVARVADSIIATPAGLVRVVGTDDSEINTIAVGGAGAETFALGGGVATNDIESTMEASIVDSSVSADSDIEILAANSNRISAITGGLAGAGAAAIGAGVSLNEIDANVAARMTDTQATSGNSVRVTASSDSSIEALAAGGAGAGSFALGGSVGTNEVQSEVEALVTGSDVTVANDVDVSALNASGIGTVSGGLAGSGAAAIGAGISLNEIESNVHACVIDSQINSGGDVAVAATNSASIEALAIGGAGAATFALGGSVSVNRIGGMICSCIMDDSNVIAAGGISVTTFDASQIHALAPGLAGAGAVAIGFSVVDNDTNRILKAVISDSDVDAGNDVVVDVNSRSSHRAIAVGGALAADVAVAGSSSSNRITQYTDAAVEGETSVVAGRDVVIHSATTEVIETDVIQGAGSAGFSIAGAIASNHVDTVGRARVGKGVDVNAVGNVSIEAVDQTAVDSNAGEVGVGVYVAGAGASISTVQVHKDVQAFIDAQANVQATAAHPGTIQAYTGEHDANGNFLREEIRGIEVQATSNETIKNRTFGVNAGLYAGVAAAVTATVVQPHVEAWIGKEATVDADSGGAPGANGEKVPTNVNVSAVNHSTIEDFATGVGLGIAGVSGAVDVGRVRHFVWGHVDNDADVKALNDIDVHGLSQKMIDSNTVSGGAGAVGLSGSVSVWNIGAPFNAEYMLNGTKMKALESGGTAVDEFASAAADLVNVRLDKRFGPGTPSKKDLYSDLHAKDRLSGVIATIKKNAILTAGDDIDVRAREWMQIDISTGGAGVGIYAGVGAAVAVTNVHSDTDAGVFGHLNAGNDTRVQATLEETTVSKSLSGEIGIGAAGAAVGVVNESSEQSARVAYGGWIESTDRLLVEADEYLDVDVTTGQGTLGLVAIAAAVSEIHEEGLTEAYLSDATIGDMFDGGAHDVCDPSLSQVRLAVVRSDVDHDLTTKAFAIEAGGLSVSVTRSEVDDQHRSDSWVGDGSTVMLRESLLVGNRTFLNGDAGLTAVTAGAVAVAVPVSRVEMQPDVSTYVEDAHVCVGDDVFIQTNNDSLANAQGYAAGISAAGLEAIRVDALAHPDVDTWIKGRETRIQAGNDVSVESSVTQNALVNATRGAVSGFALGSMNAKADNSGSTSTRIGESAKLLVGNNLDIRSDASGESAVDVISPTVSGAIIQDNNVSAVASFDTEARLGATGVVVVGGNTTIESLSDRSAATDVASIGVSGLMGATSNAQSIADGRNDAVLAGRLNSTSDLTVVASERNRTVTNADSFSVSGVTLSGLDSKTNAKPVVRAVVSAPVDATGDIAIMANADMETSASGRTIGVSAVTAGQANITAESTPTVVAELTGAAEVNTDGDISLLAEHSLGPVVAGEPVVTGFAAEVGLIGGYTGINLIAESIPTVAAHVGDGAEIIEADDLEVKAQSETQMSVVDEAFSLMGAIGIGGTNSAIHSGGNTSSNLGGIIGKVDDVDVSARNESVVNAGSTATSLAVVGAVPSGRAETSVDPHVQSTLTTDVYASGNVNMRTESVSDADSEVRYDSGALLAAVGNTEAHSSVSPVIETVVSSEVTVHADGSINLESLHNVDQSGSFLPNGASSSSEAAAYAGGAAASNSIATATSNPSISTRADERAELFTEQGDIALRSQSFSDATAVADATQVGAGGVGSVESVAVSSGSVESVLNGVESATARNGDIEVFALTRNDSAVSGVGTQGGILAGLGNAVETNARSAPNVSARAGATNVIDAGNDVRLIAMGAGDVDADAAETSRSLLFNLGAVNARGSYEPVVESLVLPDTTITAGNDVNLLGYGNVLDASGAYDTARAVNVDSVSRGAALVTGRSAASESNVDSLVTAFIGDNANVNAGNDAVVNARSYTQVDTDSFTRLIALIGFQCVASATNFIEVSTLSGSPDLTSPSGFTLTAGDDIEVVSDTDLRSGADSDAVVTGPGWAQANSVNDISDVDTVALLGNGTSTNAGDTVLVHADKFVGTSVTANTGLFGSANTSDSITANTAAIVTGTATSIGGTSITVSVVDPIVSKVKSTVTDRNSSAEDFAQAVKEGRIGAQAGVAADVVLLSGIDDGVAVNADKVRVINTLAKLDLSADAELNTRHQHEIELLESEELKLKIHTKLGDAAEISRKMHSDPESAIGYRAVLKEDKRGGVSAKEKFREFGQGRKKGKATASSVGFETDKDRRKKNEDNVDLIFQLIGRDIDGYKS